MDELEYQEKLGKERQQIDQIDKKLLPLFMERMKCVERVARLKQAADAPVFNAQREKEILERVYREAGALGSSAVAFFQAIMSISKAREHGFMPGETPLTVLERDARRQLPNTGRVVCQGAQGAYSQQAARSLLGDREIEFVPNFEQVFHEVDQGALGVLPVENSDAGSVTAVYDLILRYRFFIVGAIGIKVEHCLATAGNGPITKVLSHPQALLQCSQYITTHGLKTEEFSNTAAAAEYIAKEQPAGVSTICSVEAAERCGLHIAQRNIQNVENNTTRFVAIFKEAVLPEKANKISLCFSLPHTTGSLHQILQRFAICGLNLTKIESRPIPGSKFEYDFYLDFTGNIHDSETLGLICALHTELPRFSFLGNYSESGETE
ncbi:bifunctional chorismate mutase/prephenate dehydratase [Acutalibacter caecimuris]|uniref:bifunctional chorismate mutase/prephenate dehydratase n=1 Tax=Acutalibacter caecimuris TaxID=3093657 RepID=UPI002AC8AF5B|nr:prephenate dehydratase domain-containing protein [Acutalibacter sp. M00118]